MKAIGDMDHMARLRIIGDCFVAGHDSCELRRHMDSVAPETPIRDIVDRCRVWESHADSDNRRFGRPGPQRALPIYAVDDVGGGETAGSWRLLPPRRRLRIIWRLCSRLG